MTTGPIASGQIITAVQRVTPNNGDTINIELLDGDVYLILAPSGPLTSLTLNWPTTPYNGSSVLILSTQQITGITHTGNTLNIPFTNIQAQGSVGYIYDQVGAIYMDSDYDTTSSGVSITYNTTVTSAGNAYVYPTSNGTSGGTPIFSSISAVVAFPSVANPLVACGAATKTLTTITVPCQTVTFNGISLLSTNVLGSYTLGNTANGVAITVIITGVLAS